MMAMQAYDKKWEKEQINLAIIFFMEQLCKSQSEREYSSTEKRLDSLYSRLEEIESELSHDE